MLSTSLNKKILSLNTHAHIYRRWSEMYRNGKSVRLLCDGSSDLSFMMGPLSYFSYQPVFHDWCNKSRGMCYPVCWMMHIKEPLLLIGKSSPCCGSGFPLSLSEWFFNICLMPYNRIYIKCAELNKTFPSFLRSFIYRRYSLITKSCMFCTRISSLINILL